VWDQHVSQMYVNKVKHKKYNFSCCVLYIVVLCTSVDKAAFSIALLTAMLKLCATLQWFFDAINQKENS